VAAPNSAATSILARGIEILSFVSQAGQPVSVPEIVKVVNMPKPTVHRICGVLERMGLLSRDLEPKRLTVGPALTAMSLTALRATTAMAPYRSILRRVVDEVHETCTLTILEFDELVFLDRVESASPLRLQLFAGSRVPLHCTSAGKLFLAMLPPARRFRLIRARPLTRYTENTITDPYRLEQELEEIRRERLGRDSEEFIEGLVALATPVLDSRGRMVAAVSVNGPAARLNLDRKERYADSLRRAATSLGQLLEGKTGT